MAALEGAGDSCEAVLGDFVTSPGWVPGLDSLGARGRNQRGDPGSARVAAPPWDVTAYIVARCQELGMRLSGVPLEGICGVQRLGSRAGSDVEAGRCTWPEWLLMKQNFSEGFQGPVRAAAN